MCILIFYNNDKHLDCVDRKSYVSPVAPVLEDEDKKKVVFVIARVGGLSSGSGTARTHQSPFTVRNVSNCDIRVYPKSNLALTFTLNTYPQFCKHILNGFDCI
jgi:hypothetical protein